MNDRFKFRAWDKSFSRMIYNIFFFWKENTITVYELHKDASKSYLPNSHIVLEQCTGLKDTSGRLIYEGDLLLLDPDDPPALVVWDKDVAMFCLVQEDVCYTFDNCSYSSQEMEVVGNIHENPELLEEK